MATTTNTADGTTIWNCRPYIDYINLEKFDEKASKDNRVNWWERFSNMALQGFWSDTMKILQEPDAHSVQGLIHAAIRDCFTQLPKSTHHDWKQMSHRFRKLYIDTTGSYSERYFTMKMTDHETPLQFSYRLNAAAFFYRLNADAVKAEVKFKSSSKLRVSHIGRYIKKLQNDQLKTALEGHRFQSIADLNVHYVATKMCGVKKVMTPQLLRSPEISVPTTFTKADLRIVDRLDNPEVFADQAEAHSKPISEFPNGGIDGEVFRIAENQHWTSPNPHPGQGAIRPENWDGFCEKCRKWGTLKSTVGPE
ncbi:LOW QUALITY PROTEIN: hypothetical protein PHMEG_00023686 [Phytophthora megakarya]|uniref:Eukaryotic/viral aspartic protease n=1 Tax=Phytophthora megakarya TaxID=4795 RepID=A0A225VI10_9STRA|nr:LOW QUALITY PROTEIN: hypothetical protein PHMEG_00023686 [Phytophthora megakarya]